MSPAWRERLSALRARAQAAAVRVGRGLAFVLLTAMYWLVVGPVAVLMRVLGADLLARRRRAASGWTPVAARGARERLEGAG